MSDNGVSSVDNLCIISSLIEHTHIKTKNVGDIDCSAHSTFIGAYNHHVVGIELKILNMCKKTFDKLISRLYRLKTVERYSVLDSGVVSIKCDDVINTHIYKLLKSQSTVK